MRRRFHNRKTTWSLGLLLAALLALSQLPLAAQEPLIYFTPWAGRDGEKERRILSWASEVSGQPVEIINPGSVNAVAEQLLLYRTTGLSVDVVWNHQSTHHQFDRINGWLDLRPFVENDPLVDFEMFAPGALQFFTGPDGRITALPFRWSFTVLNYNKDLFDEAGLGYPDSTWRYEVEFLEAAKRLTRRNADGTVTQWGVVPLRLHEFIWRAWGANLLTPDRTASGLLDPRAVDALQFLRDLYVVHEVAATSTAQWDRGNAGMMFENPVLERNNSNMRWDIAEVPLGPAGVRVTRGAVGAWSIPSWSDKPERAWELIRHLASKEGQIRYLEEGLGGTRFDSIQEFMIDNYDPSKFQVPLHPDTFHNRDVYLQAMQYAVIDTERQLLAEYVPELGFGGNTPLGNTGAITRDAVPVTQILEELSQKINAALRQYPNIFNY